MKKLIKVLIMIIILSSISSCSNEKSKEANDTYFYIGQSNTWLATYTITKVKSVYYDSLTIQYIVDETMEKDIVKIGTIEYQLKGNSLKMESSYPQELQGIGNFHTGSSMNADIINKSFDKQMEISIQWKDNNDTIMLKRQN